MPDSLQSFVRKSITLCATSKERKRMKSENKSYLTILLLLIISICQAQNTTDDIETHLFSEIFNSNDSISEFMELNEKNDTTRYWIFDDNGKLTKEVDCRNNSWSSSINGQITFESTTYRTEFVYNYNQYGELSNFTETKNIDGNIQTIIHEFKYPSSDTIVETFKIDYENIKMEFEVMNINENKLLKKIVQVMKNHIGESYVQSIQRMEFLYNQENNLTNQNQYFSVNSFFENEILEPMNETLGANTNYIYDEEGRLVQIYEEEYTKEELPKLRKNVIFKYKGNTKRIENIRINYGKSYEPSFVAYEVKYKQNGDLRYIKVNDNCFNYLTKR